MLKKLYRYEYYSLFRSLLPIYFGLICLAVVGRMLYLFDNDSLAYSITSSLSATFYILGIVALFIVGMVIVVTRFYKNLLGGEGYLTFTLPFTPTQHIVCKLLCAVSVMLINLAVVLLSLMILGAGSDMMKEIFTFIKDFFALAHKENTLFKLGILIAEIVLFLILYFFQAVLMFYAAMAIGQQFRNRIGGAVVAYICLYVAIEVIRNVSSLILLLSLGDDIENFFAQGIGSVQVLLLFPIAGSALISAACFLATRYFLTGKLNLE